MAAGTNMAPLPPSVEEAYKRKCIELKRRMTEVEESNDAFRLRKVRLTRGIRKMRLERAYLLETLGKRMKKNGSIHDGLQGMYDEDSEDSSEGPPTPHEKPLRSKRSHRRPLASPPPIMDYQMPHPQPYQPNYSPHSHMHHEQRTYPQQAIPHANGHPQEAYTTTFPVNPAPPQLPEPPNHTNSMLTPIPPVPAFHMFYEQKFLSQMHKYNIKDDKELAEIAQKEWQEASEGTRQMYLMQENQQRHRYDAQMGHLKDQEGRNGRYVVTEEPRYEDATRYDTRPEIDSRRGGMVKEERDAFEVEKERAERERAEVEAAERVGRETKRADEDVEMRGGGGGGFTSINHG